MSRDDDIEAALREVWGVMILVSLLYPDDPKVQAAVRKVNARCEKTGLMAREGIQWIEREQTP